MDESWTAAAGPYVKRRVRYATRVRTMRFLKACWIGDCGGGTLYKVTSPLRDARPKSVITAPVAECVVKVFFFGFQQTSPSDKLKSPSCSTTGCLLSFFVAGQR